MERENRSNQPERRETVQNGDTEADEGLHPDNIVSLHMSDEQISILAEKIAQAVSIKTQQPHVSDQNELPTSGT